MFFLHFPLWGYLNRVSMVAGLVSSTHVDLDLFLKKIYFFQFLPSILGCLIIELHSFFFFDRVTPI